MADAATSKKKLQLVCVVQVRLRTQKGLNHWQSAESARVMQGRSAKAFKTSEGQEGSNETGFS
jgi:hypothetical protein